MTPRQELVLAHIVAGGMYGRSAADIGGMIGAPEPSVRRAIQELIRLGHNVSYASDGLYYYRKGY